MYNKIERLNTILSVILRCFTILFVICGLEKAYLGEDAFSYFLLAGCFAIISANKKK